MDDMPLHTTTTAKRRRRRRSALAVITGACLAVAGLTGAGSASAAATTPATGATGAAAPAAGSHASAPGGGGTHFLDHAALLKDLNDKSWYESNIPFVDLSDSTIRTSTTTGGGFGRSTCGTRTPPMGG